MALPVCSEVNRVENLHGFSNLCSLSRPRAVYRHSVWFHRHVHAASDRRIKWWCLSAQGYASKAFFFFSPLRAVVAVGRDNSLSNCIGFVSLTGQSLCRRPKISRQRFCITGTYFRHSRESPSRLCVVSFLLEIRQSWSVTLNQPPAPDVVHSHHQSADIWPKCYVDRA